MDKIPTISLMDPEDKIVAEMKEACMQNGFFQVTDYGKIMSPDLSARTLEASRRFFDLPLDIKRSLFKPDHISEGYEPYKTLNLEPTNPKGYGHNEGFSFASPAFPTAWPSESQLPKFRQTMEEYYRGVTYIAQSIGRYLALGLDLPKEYFDDFFEAQLAHVKLAHYFRPEGDANDSMIGVASHTDWGAITVLLQDDIGGLEVFDQQANSWIEVSPTPNAFVINLGDLLARWTNDKYKSTPHRVTSPPAGVHRYSIPFFSQGKPDYIVKVIESCVEKGDAPRYPPIRAEDYLKLKFESTYKMSK